MTQSPIQIEGSSKYQDMVFWLTVEVEVIMEAREMETKPIMTLVNYSSSQKHQGQQEFHVHLKSFYNSH